MRELLGLDRGEALEQFLSEVPFGVVVLDRELRYRWANDAFVKMSGLGSVEGHGVGATYPTLGERLAPVLHAVMDSGEPFEWVVHGGAEPESGGGRAWRARYVPLRTQRDEICGVAALLIDITHEARLERAQQVLEQLSTDLSEIDDPDGVAVAVPDLLVPDFLDAAVLYVRDANGRYRLEVARGEGIWQDLARRSRHRLGEGESKAADRFIDRGRPRSDLSLAFAKFVDDDDDRELLARAAAATPACIVLPLTHAQQPLGLMVGFSHDIEFFTDENSSLLMEAARIAAAAMFFARLHDTVRVEQRRAELLQELGFRCALATTTDDVCSAVLSVGGPVVGARTVGISLVLPHSDGLRAWSRDIERDTYRDYESSLDSNALLAQAIRRNELICATTRDEIERRFPGSAVANSDFSRSACAIPLTAGGRVIGSVGFAFEHEGSLTQEQTNTVRLVADQAAAALERVWLDEQRRAAIAQFQASLLPASLPQAGHVELAAQYRPAPEGIDIGGDWYDAFVRPDGSVCVIVGDAAGKGVAAATTVGALRHIVRYFAHGIDDPGAALEAANEAFLLGADVAPSIATVSLVVLHPDGSVRVSLAGHLPPVHLSGTSAALLTGVVDPPLGLRGRARRSYGVQLAPGETIVLYTDGLIERRREPIDSSLARLVAAAERVRASETRPAALVDALMRALGHDAKDDVAVLAATRPRTS